MLKKLSITEEQAQKVRELLDEGLSSYKIAKQLKISQPKIWRNMRFMGLVKVKQEEEKPEIFRWEDYKNNCII